SETESWGDSDKDDNEQEEASDNDDDENTDDDDDNAGNDDVNDDDENDDDENVDDEEQQEEEKDENADECVPTPEDMNFSDTEDDEEKNEKEEDHYEMLYRDVNVNLQQEDVDMTKADQGGAQDSDLQYEDAHVTLTASQKTVGQTQSSSVSSDFISKLLNLENVSPANYTLASVMDTTAQQTSSTVITTTLLPPPSVIPLTPQGTPTLAPIIPVPTIHESTTYVTSQVPAFVDEHLTTRLGYAVQTAFQSYKIEFEKEAQAEQEIFIEIIDKSVKEMVKDEVKSQLTKILPKKIADFATPLIESTVADSHERVVLAKSSSQLNKSYQAAPKHKELYDSLAKSYKLDKDLFDTYSKAYSLKRDREENDKDEDPSAGPDRGEKRRKTDKDAESSKDPKSKGSKSSSSSKGTSYSPHKSTGKSPQTEEPRHDSGMPHD
ncbi:hypothetical protein Tco_0716366, partial [Tanacetum coccineum]